MKKRICSTPSCEREAQPYWTLCADCAQKLFDRTMKIKRYKAV